MPFCQAVIMLPCTCPPGDIYMCPLQLVGLVVLAYLMELEKVSGGLQGLLQDSFLNILLFVLQ